MLKISSVCTKSPIVFKSNIKDKTLNMPEIKTSNNNGKIMFALAGLAAVGAAAVGVSNIIKTNTLPTNKTGGVIPKPLDKLLSEPTVEPLSEKITPQPAVKSWKRKPITPEMREKYEAYIASKPKSNNIIKHKKMYTTPDGARLVEFHRDGKIIKAVKSSYDKEARVLDRIFTTLQPDGSYQTVAQSVNKNSGEYLNMLFNQEGQLIRAELFNSKKKMIAKLTDALNYRALAEFILYLTENKKNLTIITAAKSLI